MILTKRLLVLATTIHICFTNGYRMKYQTDSLTYGLNEERNVGEIFFEYNIASFNKYAVNRNALDFSTSVKSGHHCDTDVDESIINVARMILFDDGDDVWTPVRTTVNINLDRILESELVQKTSHGVELIVPFCIRADFGQMDVYNSKSNESSSSSVSFSFVKFIVTLEEEGALKLIDVTSVEELPRMVSNGKSSSYEVTACTCEPHEMKCTNGRTYNRQDVLHICLFAPSNMMIEEIEFMTLYQSSTNIAMKVIHETRVNDLTLVSPLGKSTAFVSTRLIDSLFSSPEATLDIQINGVVFLKPTSKRSLLRNQGDENGWVVTQERPDINSDFLVECAFTLIDQNPSLKLTQDMFSAYINNLKCQSDKDTCGKSLTFELLPERMKNVFTVSSDEDLVVTLHPENYLAVKNLCNSMYPVLERLGWLPNEDQIIQDYPHFPGNTLPEFSNKSNRQSNSSKGGFNVKAKLSLVQSSASSSLLLPCSISLLGVIVNIIFNL